MTLGTTEEPSEHPAAAHDPYAALRLRNFRFYLAGNFMAIFGMQAQTLAVGWELYERTHSAFALGLEGLVQFLPVAALTLPAGHEADRSHRKAIVMIAMATMACCSLGLAWISIAQGDVGLIYICLLASGVARAFLQPAKASLLPQIVPRETFSNAVTWNMNAFQMAAITGPAVAGQLIGWFKSAWIVYVLDAGMTSVFLLFLAVMHVPRHLGTSGPSSLSTLLAGLSFVWRHQVILGAMALDMFAVLLGGAVTLLPIFALDVLEVGPRGLGWLRTAPAIGALMMSFLIAHRPPVDRAGRALLTAVAGFGLATIAFGVSKYYALSLAMLFLTGTFDIVSVVIRHTLVQLLTPDAMRGRVSAVNSMFIGASNELGGFESGVVAAWFGVTASVVSGGIGTLAIVVLAAWLWPELRRYGQLTSGHDS